jgi:cyclohexanone monooxygenase
VSGITLSDYWALGRRSLHDMLVHSFPNMDIISGLKQAGITRNIVFMNRRQVEHMAAPIKRNIDAGTDFDVTPQAEDRLLDLLRDWIGNDAGVERDLALTSARSSRTRFY